MIEYICFKKYINIDPNSNLLSACKKLNLRLYAQQFNYLGMHMCSLGGRLDLNFLVILIHKKKKKLKLMTNNNPTYTYLLYCVNGFLSVHGCELRLMISYAANTVHNLISSTDVLVFLPCQQSLLDNTVRKRKLLLLGWAMHICIM